MGLFNMFSSSSVKKGERIADSILSLLMDNTLRELLAATPEPMKSRLQVNHLCVYCGAALAAIILGDQNDTAKSHDAWQAFGGKIHSYLDKRRDLYGGFNPQKLFIDSDEKHLFIQRGFPLDGTHTDFGGVFSVIADHRANIYSEATIRGLSNYVKHTEPFMFTGKILTESKRLCGKEGFPLIEMQMIYNPNIAYIIAMGK